jgi:hypothetical protein
MKITISFPWLQKVFGVVESDLKAFEKLSYNELEKVVAKLKADTEHDAIVVGALLKVAEKHMAARIEGLAAKFIADVKAEIAAAEKPVVKVATESITVTAGVVADVKAEEKKI